jgi:hypothetical protein
VLGRALRLAVAVALLAIGPTTLARAAAPLYTEAPGGPIPLVGAPNSLVGEYEGEGFGEGNGSVLIGYDGRKSSEILQNTPRGLFYLGDYHQPRGPGKVFGDSGEFAVIDAPRRLVRLYGGGDRFPLARTLRTGADPVAVAISPFELGVSILNRGSADLWAYARDDRGKWHLEAKLPIGGEPTDLVGRDGFAEPVFVSDAATDSVTELFHLEEGAVEFERRIPVGKDPVDLTLGEFVRRHDDEQPEVAVADRGSDTVTILDGGRPGPDGSYPYRRIGTYAAGDEPVAVLATNVDEKGGDDLAVVDAGSDRLTLLLNDGHGHFHRAASYPTGRDPVAVAEIEFDGSFSPDLVVADHGSHSLTVLLRREPGVCRGREARPITGTPGDDRLRGGRGVDLIRGLGGDDSVFGWASGDCLYGGPGDDVLLGNSGGDLIDGGPGDDRILGGPPEFNPSRGRDTIIGGPGRERIRAGAADDLVRAADGERDRVSCGGGHDVAFVDPEDVVVGCERIHVVGPPGRR